MRRPLRGLVVLAALAPLAAVLPATQAPAASSKSCKRVVDIGPTGMDPADAVALRATVTNCSTARRLARTWGREIVMQTGPTIRIRSYRCKDRTSGGRVRVTCTAGGGRVVRFRLG